MRAVIQRVSRASVTVVTDDAGDVGERGGADAPAGPADTKAGEVVGSIGPGLCVLVGVTHSDTEQLARKLAERLWKLRIFADDEGKMNRSVADIGGAVLIISQFTLYADARKGNRPSYVDAARPEQAEPLIEVVVEHLRSLGAEVATGRFGGDMKVDLLNDGPVTISLELDA